MTATARRWARAGTPATREGCAAGAAPARDERHFWERTSSIWHVVFVVTVLGCAMEVAGSADLTTAGRVATLALLGATLPWYAATGARTLRGADPRLGHLYLIGAAPLFAALLLLHPSLTYLTFTAIPQIFIFIDSLLWASVSVVGLYVGTTSLLLARVPELRVHPGGLLFGLGISLAFSLAFGGWISGIIRQSRQRADLIGELEATRAALAAERHEAGVLTERTRLAAEIHDTLAQGFTSILMLTQAAETSVERDPAAAREQLTLIEHTARENLAEARSLVAALAPAALDGATLRQALDRLAVRHRTETGTSVQVAVTGEPASTPETDVVLLRVVQEALSNVRKHAGARRVEVTLGYGDDGTTLTVVDDGAGFDPGRGTDGYGLRGMRHRVEKSGGTVTVTSEPGTGTAVTVVLP
jgi:signal transduction histidine kinase